MLRKSLLLLAPLIGLIMNGLAGAQQEIPVGKWWKMPAVAKRMNLSGREISQLDEAYRQSRREMIRSKADMETEQLELQAIIEKPDMVESDALKQYERLDHARSELGLARFRFFLRVRAIVGHERFNTLLRFRELRKQRARQQGHQRSVVAE